MRIRQFGFIAPDDHHLRPVTTYASPSRSIRAWMLVASELATSGSVMQKADRICPSSSGASHCSFCSALPNIASTSMLPVSGAEQFIASGARIGLRPLISASGAYWRLVRPAPCSPGRKRFQSPRPRASALSFSMIGGVSHIVAGSASSSRDCSASTASAGYTCSVMNAASVAWSSVVAASNPKSTPTSRGRAAGGGCRTRRLPNSRSGEGAGALAQHREQRLPVGVLRGRGGVRVLPRRHLQRDLEARRTRRQADEEPAEELAQLVLGRHPHRLVLVDRVQRPLGHAV